MCDTGHPKGAYASCAIQMTYRNVLNRGQWAYHIRLQVPVSLDLIKY